MPILEDVPLSVSTIRKRALLKTLERAREFDKLASLQVARDPALSSLERDELSRRIDLVRKHQSRVSDELAAIEQQNAAVRRSRSSWNAADQLERVRRRQGLFRSEADRNAAILGFLERERSRNAALTRDQWRRAQATAASRGKYDVKQAYRLSGMDPSTASFRGEADFYSLRGVDVDTPPYVDPCVEYRRRQRNRREVFFARGIAGRGYRSPHSRPPC